MERARTAPQARVRRRGPCDRSRCAWWAATACIRWFAIALGIGGPSTACVGRTAWRATIDAAAAPATFREPQLQPLARAQGPSRPLPGRGRPLINIVAAIDDSRADQRRNRPLVDPRRPGRDPAQASRPGRDPDPAAGGRPRAWGTWPLIDRPPLRALVAGPVTLLGDAAHPMLPFLAQGAAQAIEDAAALGDAVRDHPLDLAAAFQAYEAARRPRATRVQAESRRQGDDLSPVRPALGRPATWCFASRRPDDCWPATIGSTEPETGRPAPPW